MGRPDLSAANRAEPVAGSVFRALPSLRLHLLARLSERAAEAEYLRLFGLRLVEARVIGLAGAAGCITLTWLCAELELEKAYASRLVARLAARGLLERAPNPADQRSTLLRATAEGERLRGAIYAAAAARNARLMAALPEARRAAFLEDLDALAGALRGDAPPLRRACGAGPR